MTTPQRRARLLAALGFAVAFVFSTVAAGQQEQRPTPIGIEGIKSALTSHAQWTLYWDRAEMGERPRFGAKTADRSMSVPVEFMRVGSRLMVGSPFRLECEAREVTITDHGFSFEPCASSRIALTYDPADTEYPFKGRTDGTLLWLAPSR